MLLNSYISGLSLGTFVYLLGRCLDMTISADSYLRLLSEKGELLNKGLILCKKNLLGIGPVLYCAVDVLFINHMMFFSIREVSDIIIIHSVGYYVAHRLMHVNSSMKKFHVFHHQFDQLLIPSIGNAVSIEEFWFAYMLPFIIGSILVRPASLSFITGIGAISICNLMIHCKELEDINYYEIFISPKKHIAHHKISNKHYSAPILDLEYLLKKTQ